MNPLTVLKLFLTPTKGWKEVVKNNPQIPQLFLFYVIPLSLIPSLIIGHASSLPVWEGFNLINHNALGLVGTALFLIQLIVVAMMAVVIRQLADIADTKISFDRAFSLAAICPTPLWLSAVALLIPNSLVVIVAVCLALMASVGLMYYGVPQVFKIKNQGQVMVLFGGILIAGVVAMGFLMIATLVIWGSLQNLAIS